MAITVFPHDEKEKKEDELSNYGRVGSKKILLSFILCFLYELEAFSTISYCTIEWSHGESILKSLRRFESLHNDL